MARLKKNENYFSPEKRDLEYWKGIEEVIKENNITMNFLSNHFNSFVMRRHSNIYLAYYEIFKKVVNLPGCFGEFGVYWGSGLFSWLNLMETFLPLDRGRKLYGFDDFEGFNRKVENFEESAVEYINEITGNFIAPENVIDKLIDIKNSDNLLPDHKRVKLYKGNINSSWEKFRQENPGVRFCLACIDFNVYQPTKFILHEINNLIVSGGIIVLRGYGVKPWEGESKSVDEFLEENKDSYQLKNIDFSFLPAAYLIKI